MVSRREIQEKINALKALYSEADTEFIKKEVGKWLDTKELENLAFTQEQMKQRIMDDLNSYLWEEN